MTVYSWNMLFRNKRREEALAFVRNSGADIFCIQEVPEDLFADLKAAYPHSAEGIDMDRLFPERPIRTYNVILSRYPVKATRVIPLTDYQSLLPWRTHFFIWIMRPFGWSRIRNRNAVYADLETPRGLIRIITVHLTLSNPAWRLEEFEMTMAHRDPSLPTIVCGDFNILESPRVSLINWLAGGRVSDALQYSRERIIIEKHFVSYELANPLAGTRTHPLSRSQLDHILLSPEFVAKDARIIDDRHGSDHHPIVVELH